MFKSAKITAFGSTRRPGVRPQEDTNIQSLVEAGPPVVTIFGKSWDFHVTSALNTTLEENLAMIGDSVAYLLKHFEEVIYDAEHFFDGFKKNRGLRDPDAPGGGGRGRALPGPLRHQRREPAPRDRRRSSARSSGSVKAETPLGIHVHNDTDCAVANSLAAVSEGIGHVQGTINGYGERCGNANLVSIIPNLMLKMGLRVHPAARTCASCATCRASSPSWPTASRGRAQPYVGDSAFAHKGGIHVSAVLKHPETYEHTDPDLVGNHRRVLVSELAGQSNILWKAREYGIDLDKNTPEARRILEMLKRMEDEGFQFEGAEASFELLMERALGNHRPYFDLDGYRVIVEENNGDEEPVAEATVRLRVKGIAEHTAAAGNGPVNALDHALRKALEDFYPNLREMSLLDYKVRILDESKGTGAKTRVLVTSGDGNETWGTVGVADNIIEASWQALVDSIEYKLRRDERKGQR